MMDPGPRRRRPASDAAASAAAQVEVVLADPGGADARPPGRMLFIASGVVTLAAVAVPAPA
jgi:hypothetical protein